MPQRLHKKSSSNVESYTETIVPGASHIENGPTLVTAGCKLQEQFAIISQNIT